MKLDARRKREAVERAQEAVKWLRKYGHLLPPEELPPERVRQPNNTRTRAEVSWGSLEEGAYGGLITVIYDEQHRFVPMQGVPREVDADSAAVTAYVKHVLGHLSFEKADILRARHVEGLTQTQIGPTQQAASQRLATAERAFLQELRRHLEAGFSPEVTLEDY